MKVVKHGNKFVLKSTTVTCPTCDCVFNFSQQDCNYTERNVYPDGVEVDIVSLIFSPTQEVCRKRILTIDCPECKTRHKLDDKYCIVLERTEDKDDSTKTEE